MDAEVGRVGRVAGDGGGRDVDVLGRCGLGGLSPGDGRHRRCGGRRRRGGGVREGEAAEVVAGAVVAAAVAVATAAGSVAQAIVVVG